ncbi:MAG: hypothetical protein OER97_06140 [Gammaproteobacteria bacterium]|nr:hypothetical protein [Gammaproteobacteria bacterium]
MVASHAAMTESPQSVVLEMSEHMQALAAKGDWSEVENLAARLRGALLDVPEAERRSVLMAVHRATEKVAAEAISARSDVTGKLSALRRGQVATKAYASR